MTKKVRLCVEVDLDIPDEWGIGHPFDPSVNGHLVIDGKYYMPNIEWLEWEQFQGHEAGVGGWALAKGAVADALSDVDEEVVQITIKPVE